MNQFKCYEKKKLKKCNLVLYKNVKTNKVCYTKSWKRVIGTEKYSFR